jgi:CheY-like chemotaxis protein
MNLNEPVVLLAEDDPNDVFFMRRALTKAEITFPLNVVNDGQEAIDYLAGTDKFGDRTQYPLPSLILLDLKMPFLDGFEVLAHMQSQPSLKDIPVLVLTSSAEDRDRQRAAELGAKGYFVKPPTRETVTEILGFLNSRREKAAVSA